MSQARFKTLSVAIIAKDEEAEMFDCLASVAGAHEIVVVDTGSKDDTAKIARQLRAKVKYYKWNDDFASAYNYANRFCTADWILSLDADERLAPEQIYELIRFIQEDDLHDAYRLILDYPSEIVKAVKLFQNSPKIYWKGKAHKYISTNDIGLCDICIKCHLSISHKYDPKRTQRILEKAIEEDASLIRERYYLAREYAQLRLYDKAFWMFEEFLLKHPDADFFMADANLYIAKLYKILNDYIKAKEYARMATYVSPEFKEAWEFLAFLSKGQVDEEIYTQVAGNCTNKNIWIIRKKSWLEV